MYDRADAAESDSFPVPIYLLVKGDKRLGRNDVIVMISRYAGKEAKNRDWEKMFPRWRIKLSAESHESLLNSAGSYFEHQVFPKNNAETK